MWQHKQEERELKRTEGDIIKNQRAVRHTLRDFENGIYRHLWRFFSCLNGTLSEINEQYLNKSVSILHMVSCVSIYIVTAINKKRMAEEKKLSQGLEKYTVLRRDHVHRKEEVCMKKNIEREYFLWFVNLHCHGYEWFVSADSISQYPKADNII